MAEVNRVGAVQTLREWILQSVCGSNWAGQQREAAAIEELDPISKWWQVQHSFPGLVLPSKRPSRRLPETLPDLALAEVGQRLPPAWWDGTVADVSPDDAALLDPVFQKLLNDRDICIDTEALTASLRLANESLCGSHLADLVVPATGGDALLSWSISGQSISALADSLFGWTKEFLKLGRGRQSWKKEELADWMTLLLYPEQLRKRPWRAVLEKLLLDRPVARAGAFLAWRVEQNARLEAMSEPTLSGKTSAI